MQTRLRVKNTRQVKMYIAKLSNSENTMDKNAFLQSV